LPELSLVLSLSLLSLMANSAILTFYFSDVLSDFTSKHTSHKDGFLLSLSGSTVGAVFTIVVPYLPEALPLLDLTVVLVLITWVALLHYHYNEGWIEAAFEAVIGGVLYIIILALINGLLNLWIRI